MADIYTLEDIKGRIEKSTNEFRVGIHNEISLIFDGIMIPSLDVWNDIKGFIPRCISRLEVPLSFIYNDIDFIKEFSCLDLLVISNVDVLSSDVIKLIGDNTKIRNVIYKDGKLEDNIFLVDDFYLLKDPYNYVFYKDVVVRSDKKVMLNDFVDKNKDYVINIFCNKCFPLMIEKIYGFIDKKIKDFVSIITPLGIVSVNYKEKTNSYSVIFSGEQELVTLFDRYMTQKGIKVDKSIWNVSEEDRTSVDVKMVNDFGKKTYLIVKFEGVMKEDEAKLIYDKIGEKVSFRIRFKYRDSECVYGVHYSKSSNSYVVFVTSKDSKYVNLIVSYMTRNGKNISDVVWYMTDDNYYDKDFSNLEEVDKQTRLFVNYGEYLNVSYSDFKSLYEAVSWYRKIISDGNLSPCEKVMFVYDIVKSFRYRDDPSDKDSSRASARIIETGNIVCVGYSFLFKQILNCLDDNLRVNYYDVTCYDENNIIKGEHSRNMIKIDDDKYNIHGIFNVDPTWDSDKSHIINYESFPDYSGLDFYIYFLIPFRDYKNVFSGNSAPEMFKCYYGEVFDRDGFDREYLELFGVKYSGNYLKDNSSLEGEVDKELRRYLNVSRASLRTFYDMLVNVRTAEGYSEEEAKKTIDNVIMLNKKLISRIRDSGKNIEFFKEDKEGKRK